MERRERKTYSDAHLEGLLVPGRAFLLFFGIIIKVGARYRSPGLIVALIRVSRMIVAINESCTSSSRFVSSMCLSNDSDKQILLARIHAYAAHFTGIVFFVTHEVCSV